jgi:DNA mismatch repair protein MutS2
MDKHTSNLLEFHRIRESVASYCLSEEGRKLVLSQEPTAAKSQLDQYFDIGWSFKLLLTGGLDFPFPPFPEISSFLHLFDTEGTVLTEEQLFSIAQYIDSSLTLTRFITKNLKQLETGGVQEKESALLLIKECTNIPDLTDIASAVRKVIDDQGKIRDTLPQLKSIREKMKQLSRTISQLSNTYLQDPAKSRYWQDTVPVERSGRIVLPLKANFKGKISGIVHEVSSSGATLFIEPLDIVEKNNALMEQENRFRQEVHKILKSLTGSVRENREEIKRLVSVLSHLDSILARARYSIAHSCTRPETASTEFKLIKARHPLLGGGAVPITIEIGEGTKGLIISGPNTGGKTVSLKTAGLLALMHQFGLEIPAGEGSSLPLFDNIFADIGDEQSIDEHLSTFSGHMKQIARVVVEATASSLILLDEIGSGTDVNEGSSIAMALLDYFIEKECIVIATTHQGILKHYAFSKQKIENASVDFNDDTLQPTYTIIQGIPGDSHALDIASSHGIPKQVLEKANRYLKGSETDVAHLIREISRKQKQLNEKERLLSEREAALEKEHESLEEERRRIDEQEARLKDEELRELRTFLNESRSSLENLIRELREEEITKESTQKAKKFIKEIEKKSEEEQKRLERIEKKREARQPAVPLEAGMDVYIGPSKRKGTLVKRSKRAEWIVSTGSMRINMPEKELTPLPQRKKKSESYEVPIAGTETEGKPSYEMDVRGLRLEEAVNAVETQIDKALLHGLNEFNIIHGKGEGILQQGIHDYLTSSKLVDEYHFSHPSQGGHGKTVVRLKK